MAVAAKANSGAILAAYANMAIIYQATSDRKNYVETLHKINVLDPTNARALAQLAIIASGDHHYDEADVYANRTIALKPSKDILSSVRFVKGSVAVSRRDFLEAAREFGESARLTPSNALAHFNYGLALAEQKRYDDALKQVELGARLDPANGHIKDYLGKLRGYVAALPHRSSSVPLTQFDAILKKDPHNNAALLGRAQQLAQMGRVGDAISAYLDTIAEAPESFEAHFGVAALYRKEGSFVPAKQQFQKAQQISEKAKQPSNTIKALNGLAGVELAEGLTLADFHQRSQDFTLSETHVKQAILLDPKQMELKSLLGRVYEAESRFKDAGDVYREILVSLPDNVAVYTRLSMTYKSQRDIPNYVKVWKEYQLKRPDDPTSYEYIAQIYNDTGQYEQAVATIGEMLKRKLTNSVIASARVFMGQDLAQLKRPEEARAEFTTVLGMSPSKLQPQFALQEKAALEAEQRTALKALAGLAGGENKTDDAIGYLNDLKQREAEIYRGSDRLPDGEVYKSIATLYERSKRIDKAIKEYQDMARVLPSDPVPHEELGRLYESLKKIDAAAAEYSSGAALSGKDPVPDQLKIAQMYQRNQMVDKAIATLEKLYAANQKNIEIMTTLADVYRLAKQDEKALAVYDALVKVNATLAWVQDKRAACLVNLRRYPEAEAVFVQEITRNPTAGRQSYTDLAHVYGLEGRAAAFLDFIKPRFEKSPNNATAMAVVYDEYVRLGKEADGQAYISDVIDKHPAYRRICLEAYANLLQVEKHNAASLAIYRKVANENSKDIAAWINLADQLDYNGEHEAANKIYLDQITRADLPLPQRASLQRKLAMRYAQQQKLPESRALFQKIFNDEKRDFDAAMRLGDLIEKTGTPTEAIAFYQSLLPVQTYPLIVRVDIHNRSGSLYEKLNKKADAVEEYRATLKLDPDNAVANAAIKKIQGSPNSQAAAH